jgi:hypothetical protein
LYTQSPSGCPTKVQEIHPPRGSSRDSMLPHHPTQSSIVHLVITTKVRARQVWVYKGKLDPRQKGMRLRSG